MPFCIKCGEPVTMNFCPRCGHPVEGATEPYAGKADPSNSGAPVVGAVMATGSAVSPAATAVAESYDCVACENEKRSFVKMLKITTSSGLEDTDRCGECLEVIPKDAEYFKCESSWTTQSKHGVHYHHCPRKICRACVDRSRYLREHSRYHHNEREWKTSLLGCGDGECGTTLCAMCIYYDMMVAIATCYKPVTEDVRAPTDGFGWWCIAVPVIGILSFGYPMMLIGDLLCINPCFLSCQQEYMKKRFGLEPASCPEMFFCRWRVVARAYREAALRGYPQQFCCGSRDERRAKMCPPPAGVPRSSLEAPAAAAAMY